MQENHFDPEVELAEEGSEEEVEEEYLDPEVEVAEENSEVELEEQVEAEGPADISMFSTIVPFMCVKLDDSR